MKKYLMSAAAMLCTVAALAQATPGTHPGGRKHGSHEGQHRKKGSHQGQHRHKGQHAPR